LGGIASPETWLNRRSWGGFFVLQITLEVARPLDDYDLQNVKLGLGGDHQRVNAALAIALCKQWVMTRAPSENITQLQKVNNPC